MHYRGFKLYPFQEAAITAIEEGRSVLVSAPTGAGKTVIAEYAIQLGLEQGRRVVYTSPIKALSNQKYRDFCRDYGDKVGLMTGDVTLNPDAPVQIMTTEIFRNTIFESPERVRDIAYVIMDEIHYISDLDRGTVWEESIIFAPKGIHFVGLSATISNLPDFRTWMEQVREEPVELVHTDDRPVPLLHEAFVPGHGICRITDLKRILPKMKPGRRRPTGPVSMVKELIAGKYLPCLFFCFSRRECEGRARRGNRLKLLTRAESEEVLRQFDQLMHDFEIKDGTFDELRDAAGRGILYHHAGMLPMAKEFVERLFTTGLVKLLYTTETFALGVNMPARSVVFSSLKKYDGISFDYLPTLNYYQMAGRAGRQGLDKQGNVFSIVDVEEDTAKGVRDVVFGKVAPLKSRFDLSYSAILNLYRELGRDQIESAVDASFSTYLRGGKSGHDRKLLRSRLRVLEHHGYIKDEGLTGKGRIAARLNGYEIQIAELFWAGLFEGLEPAECAVLVAAVVYQPRKGEPPDPHGPESLRSVPAEARRTLSAFAKTELKNGIENPIKMISWGLSRTVKAWANGEPFENLYAVRAGQPGDLVRNLRMTVQLLRQFAQATREDRELSDRLYEAFRSVNRDEVDAEAQLRKVSRVGEG